MNALIAAAVTHAGKVRDYNQDSYLVDEDVGMFAVADGMGGHAAGEVASALAIETVRRAWAAPALQRLVKDYAETGEVGPKRALLRAVREAVVAAHDAIVAQAGGDPDMAGMGTTFTGFLVAGGEAVFAHAGDSRAYLVRDEIAIQLSEDHTISARLAAAGLRGEDPGHDPARWQGVLTNALGVGDGARVATFVVPLYSGDRLLLCSDGVHEYFAEALIGTTMCESPSPARSAQAYVDHALASGGGDNATAVVVKIVEAGETRVPLAQQQRDEAVLAASPFLAGLSAQQRLRALRITTPREIKEGKPVEPVALGERAAYLVMDGVVMSDDAIQWRPGDLAFPRALLDATSRLERATAATSVRLLAIRRDDFLELAEDDEDIGVALFEALADAVQKR